MRYSRKASMVLLSIACLGLGPVSCRPKSPNDVAMVLKTLSNPFFVQMRHGAEAEAVLHPELHLLVQATRTETDTLEQNQIVDNLLARGIRVLCLTPDDSKGSISAVLSANRDKIPVIVVDTKLDEPELHRQGGKIATFIASDNKKGGELAGEVLAQALSQKGKVALIEGAPGQETAVARSAGFLESIGRSPNIKVVARQTAYWEREKGYSVTQAILVANPDVVGIFACNDEMALGAVRAVHDLKRDVVIVGFDYTPDGKAAIERGELYASVAQSPEAMGKLAIQSAASLIAGKAVPPFQPVPVEVKRK